MPNSNSELYVLHAWEENPVYIKCVQGEGGIKIANFKLVDDSGAINLSSATSVTFDGIKRDGSGCCVICNVVDAINGIVEFIEQTGVTDIDGNVKGTINVVFPDGNIKFDGITLYVAPNNTTKLIEASQAFSAFVEALNKLALITPEGTIAIDDVLTDDGVSAVQGKVIKAAIDKKLDNSEGSVRRENIEISAVGSGEIDSGAVDTIHLSSKSVTAEKLSDEVVNEINKKSDKSDSLAGYGILDAYTKNDINSLLNKLGTKNYSFLFDTAGRIFSFTWDNEIKEGSFGYQDDTQNGYYVWLGKDVNNVTSGALQNVGNIKKIWCENSEENISFATDYDSVAKSFGQNPLSEFYKLVSIAKLHNEKADKSNSLSGYGIEDAYTKAEVDTALSGKIDDSDGAVKRENIENNAVGTDEIDSGAVETVNIADSAVTSDKIANKAVTSDKIANGAITALKIANGAVSGSNIAQNQISTNHLQSGAITNDKLDDELKISINGKADKSTTYTKTEVDEKSNNNVQEQINMLPKFLDMPVKVTSRALCVDGTSLYHSGTASYTVGGVKHMYATSKIDVSTETNPTFIGKLGGHDKCYPRNIAIGNGYLYVPYRDSKSGELSSFDTDTDIGGYLDIIRLSDFTLEENSITYSREPYKITTVVDGVEKEVERYFGKSHFVATYNDSLLCVTQQMGGWKLYDISTTPENPTLLYSYDNRADIYIDNADKGGYADFQQPAFFADTNGNIYLAISGYDRDLLMIYDLSDPFNPQEVFGFHCGNNQLNLRTVPEGGILTTPYIHTLGLACAYPYIYCTIAPHPNYLNDTENAFEGVIVADVSDITNVTTTVFKMPNDDRAEYDTGEPSPTSIAVNSRHLIMDNADKGISVWSLKNSAEPKYLGCLNTGTPVCSVCMTEDGRTFAGTAVGTKYIGMDSSISMYRGL